VTSVDALEAEREFLLRSLDDLDNERAAGNIDDATYARLHADYTARAATVLRRLRDGVDLAEPVAAKPSVGRRGAWRRFLPAALIVVFSLTAAGFLVQSVHDRGPGGSSSGNDQVAANGEQVSTLAKNVKDHPDDYNARIAYARALLNNDLRLAIVQYDAAAKLAPKQPEPVTYAGWISALVAGQLDPGDKDRTLLVDRAMERFSHAIAIAPTYPDTFVFRGITELRVTGDRRAAVRDLRRFLQLAPQDHPQRSLVLAALNEAESPTSTTVTPSTQP
jgi:tetratricopeptide (TPR) repeat protein